MDSWAAIAFARDWHAGAAAAERAELALRPHATSGATRRRSPTTTPCRRHQPPGSLAPGHTMDLQVARRAQRLAAVLSAVQPQPARRRRRKREAAGATTRRGDRRRTWSTSSKARQLQFAVEDPTRRRTGRASGSSGAATRSWPAPRATSTSCKHYLGTHTNAIAEDVRRRTRSRRSIWHDKAPQGKMDLVVDLNFRMDTSALYSDIVLPAATWYEKADLNSTDMHSSSTRCRRRCRRAGNRRATGRSSRRSPKKFSRAGARRTSRSRSRDLVASPLAHDTPAEIAQPEIAGLDARAKCEPIPGKTMPACSVVERDYANLYDQFISLRPAGARRTGSARTARSYAVDDVYDDALDVAADASTGTAQRIPRCATTSTSATSILRFATVTNGELAYRVLQEHGGEGRPAAGRPGRERSRRRASAYKDLQAQPQRVLQQPDVVRADRRTAAPTRRSPTTSSAWCPGAR